MSEIDLDKKVTFESETGQFGGDPESDLGIGNLWFLADSSFRF